MIKASIDLQDLRRRLYVKAKAEPSWRFWGLYVHVCKMETLRAAYEMAKENDGAPGIDGVRGGDQGETPYCLTYRCSRVRSVASFILLPAWVEEEAGCGDGRGFGAPGLLRWRLPHHWVVVTSCPSSVSSVGTNNNAFACSLRQDLSLR